MYDLGGDPLANGGGAGGGGFGQAFSFTDIMDAFFGGSASRSTRSRVRRGQDARVGLKIDLAEAVFGTTEEVLVDTAGVCEVCPGGGTSKGVELNTCPTCQGAGEIQQVQRSFLGQVMTARPCPQCQGYGTVNPSPCPECSGDGRVRQRRNLTIKVPAGVDNGTRIQLGGQGEVGPGGGPPGDLYIELAVTPHPVFSRQGDALTCTLPIPMTAAALGTSVELETLDGEVTIEVRPGAQHSEKITVPGRGVPRLRGTGRGDLVVTLDVQTPTKLDTRQQELLRELAAVREEETVVGPTPDAPNGNLFSRIRDAFKEGMS